MGQFREPNMPSAARIDPPVSIVVCWPEGVAAATAGEVARQMAAARISSTWSVENSAQADALEGNSSRHATFRAALLISASDNAAAAIDRGLDLFQKAGHEIAAIHVAQPLARGSVERRLCQAGVRAVIQRAVHRKTSTLRPLPFGIWEIQPHLSAPAARRWLGLFSKTGRELNSPENAGPTVASIELQRAGMPGSRSWRAIERLIHQATEASARGAARIITIDQLAAELSDAAASRPQRSILRTAA
jgi:hypothetical protein